MRKIYSLFKKVKIISARFYGKVYAKNLQKRVTELHFSVHNVSKIYLQSEKKNPNLITKENRKQTPTKLVNFSRDVGLNQEEKYLVLLINKYVQLFT